MFLGIIALCNMIIYILICVKYVCGWYNVDVIDFV